MGVESAKGYDLIGDVHGCAISLQLLLEKLGYVRRAGVYSHPDRQVIFLGDIVDRGPHIREALHLVRDMVEAGQAQIVMGNHEYNFLCYCTESPANQDDPFLREHNPRHFRILKETLEQFANHPGEQKDFMEWVRTIPLFLEFDNFRVIHACWHQGLIDRFKSIYPEPYLTDELLYKSAVKGSFEWVVFDRLLRGTHLRLPNGEVMVSKDGYKRQFFRTKFWLDNPQYYIDVLFQPDPLPEHIARMRLTETEYQDLLYYDEQQPLLFIGHYWREGKPTAIRPNIACLDYSAVKYGKLVAYRYDGESEIQQNKFVWVDVRKEVVEAGVGLR